MATGASCWSIMCTAVRFCCTFTGMLHGEAGEHQSERPRNQLDGLVDEYERSLEAMQAEEKP